MSNEPSAPPSIQAEQIYPKIDLLYPKNEKTVSKKRSGIWGLFHAIINGINVWMNTKEKEEENESKESNGTLYYAAGILIGAPATFYFWTLKLSQTFHLTFLFYSRFVIETSRREWNRSAETFVDVKETNVLTYDYAKPRGNKLLTIIGEWPSLSNLDQNIYPKAILETAIFTFLGVTTVYCGYQFTKNIFGYGKNNKRNMNF